MSFRMKRLFSGFTLFAFVVSGSIGRLPMRIMVAHAASAAVTVSTPSKGEILAAGSNYTVTYEVTGSTVSSVRISITGDEDGDTDAVIVDDAGLSGSYVWAVPDIETDYAVLSVEALDSHGAILASVVRGPFGIATTAVPPPAPLKKQTCAEQGKVEVCSMTAAASCGMRTVCVAQSAADAIIKAGGAAGRCGEDIAKKLADARKRRDEYQAKMDGCSYEPAELQNAVDRRKNELTLARYKKYSLVAELAWRTLVVPADTKAIAAVESAVAALDASVAALTSSNEKDSARSTALQAECKTYRAALKGTESDAFRTEVFRLEALQAVASANDQAAQDDADLDVAGRSAKAYDAVKKLLDAASAAGPALRASETDLGAAVSAHGRYQKSDAEQKKTCTSPKVQLCHLPSGDTDKANTLCVTESASKAHLDHGDGVGTCGEVLAARSTAAYDEYAKKNAEKAKLKKGSVEEAKAGFDAADATYRQTYTGTYLRAKIAHEFESEYWTMFRTYAKASGANRDSSFQTSALYTLSSDCSKVKAAADAEVRAKKAKEDAEKKAAEEKKKAEEEKKKKEEAAKKEEEARKKAAEEKKKAEEEKKKKEEAAKKEEEARKKSEEEKKKKEEAAKKEEEARKKAEEEKKKAEEEKKKAEEAKKKEEEARKKADEEKKKAEEEKKKKEEAEKKRLEDEKKAVEEKKAKEEAEKKQKEAEKKAEEEKKKKEEAEKKQKEAEEAAKKEEEVKKKAEEEKKAIEEKKKKEEAEKKQKEAEEKKIAEEKKAAEEKKKKEEAEKKEEEARKKAEEDKKAKEEAEKKQKEAEEKKIAEEKKAAEEKKKKEEAEKKQKEAEKKAEEEKKKAEEEKKKKEEAEKKQQEAEKKAEEEKKKKEEAAKKEEEARKKAEEEKKRAEEEQEKKEEAERKQKEAEEAEKKANEEKKKAEEEEKKAAEEKKKAEEEAAKPTTGGGPTTPVPPTSPTPGPTPSPTPTPTPAPSPEPSPSPTPSPEPPLPPTPQPKTDQPLPPKEDVGVKPPDKPLPEGDLGPGSTGPGVQTLCDFLRTNGFPVKEKCDTLDAEVQEALAKFQAKYTDDGALGIITVKFLNDLLRNPPVGACNVSHFTLLPPEKPFVRPLKYGDVGDDVRVLQKFLNDNGFLLGVSGPGAPGSETNLFVDRTQNALRFFQQAFGLVAEKGTVGSKNRFFINNLLPNPPVLRCPKLVPASIELNRDLAYGVTDDDVQILQTFMNVNGFLLNPTTYGSRSQETKFFGPYTRASVTRFQIAFDLLGERNRLGPLTRAFINELRAKGYATTPTKKVIPATTGPVAAVPAACGPLLTKFIRAGQSNDATEVRKLQDFLRTREGFTSVATSGTYDVATQQAVIAFQERYAADVLTPWSQTQGTAYVFRTTQKKINDLWCTGASR